MPYSTATIERTFSTLRHVKTWLRSTISEERLNGLCMLSVENLNSLGDSFAELVLSRFAENPRNNFLLSNLLKQIEGKNWKFPRNFDK